MHTAISLVAVAAGIVSLFRYRQITLQTKAGRLYVMMTVLSCLTGFSIYQHGGFGAPHVVGIVTLITLGIAARAGKFRSGLGIAREVEAVAYCATILFHMIPAVTETSTRFPLGNPLIKDRNGPELQAAGGVLLVLFLIGSFIQVRRLKRAR